MKALPHRFAPISWLAFTSAVFAFPFVACVSDPQSPAVPKLDAAPPEARDAAPDGSPVRDASVQDGTTDAITDAAPDAPAPVHADVTADFSTRANPNGAWTYGYTLGDPTGADAGALIVYSAVSNATPDIPGWYDPTNVVLGAPAAWRNDSAVTNTGIAAGEFAMHPGNAGEYAIARWTAPAAGAYAITVQFKTGDSGDTNGLLLHNGVALVTEASTSAETVHDLAVTLAAGDHIDVAVGSKGDFRFDSTPVHLTLRSAGSDP